jgi:hypothetical protein
MKKPQELLQTVQDAITSFEISAQSRDTLYGQPYADSLKLRDDLEVFIQDNASHDWTELQRRATNTIFDLGQITGVSIIPINTLRAHRSHGNPQFTYVVDKPNMSLQDKEAVLREFVASRNFKYQSVANGNLNGLYKDLIVEKTGTFAQLGAKSEKIKFELDSTNANNEYNTLVAIVPS